MVVIYHGSQVSYLTIFIHLQEVNKNNHDSKDLQMQWQRRESFWHSTVTPWIVLLLRIGGRWAPVH